MIVWMCIHYIEVDYVETPSKMEYSCPVIKAKIRDFTNNPRQCQSTLDNPILAGTAIRPVVRYLLLFS